MPSTGHALNVASINHAAIFRAADPTDPDTLPCLDIAGIEVFAYVTSAGVLRVSVHTDTGVTEPSIERPGDTIALEITINGITVVHHGEEETPPAYR